MDCHRAGIVTRLQLFSKRFNLRLRQLHADSKGEIDYANQVPVSFLGMVVLHPYRIHEFLRSFLGR